MPEISRFLGIVITIYFNDHDPPHFHARYNDYEASVEIDSLGVLRGQLPPKVLSLVVEWAGMHREGLEANWDSLRTTGHFEKIEPLV